MIGTSIWTGAGCCSLATFTCVLKSNLQWSCSSRKASSRPQVSRLCCLPSWELGFLKELQMKVYVPCFCSWWWISDLLCSHRVAPRPPAIGCVPIHNVNILCLGIVFSSCPFPCLYASCVSNSASSFSHPFPNFTSI